MDRFEPYYDDESDGVHFEVRVDGHYVQGYLSRGLMSQCSRQVVDPAAAVGHYARNRATVDAAVERRARAQGRETVLLRAEDLAAVHWR